MQKSALVLNNLDLAGKAAGYMARRVFSNVLDKDDYRQEATVALIRCARRHDPDRSTRFRAWALNRMKWSILDAVRAMHKTRYYGATTVPVTEEVIDRLVWDGVHDRTVGLEIGQILERAIHELPKALRLAVIQYYYEGMRMREIGQILGVNESRVSQMLTEARGKLRRKLKDKKEQML